MAPRKKVPSFDDKLPKGTVIKDTFRQTWILEDPVGKGGFGLIYRVRKEGSTSDIYVAKVEPHANGSLYVERNFFLRHLKPEFLESYKREKGLSFLGLPQCIGSGTHEEGSTMHRFVILDYLGEPVSNALLKGGKLNVPLLRKFCIQIVDALQYLHERGYTHGDLKPENLLLNRGSTPRYVYLIDFGLVEKCCEDAAKADPKKRHNGTLLYCSRDAHAGAPSKRGDLEILAYNVLAWYGVPLPWAKDDKPETAQEKKIKFWTELQRNNVPDGVLALLHYVGGLRMDETPDYERVKLLLGEFDLKKGKTKETNVIEDAKENEIEPPKKKDPNQKKKLNVPEDKTKERKVLPKKKAADERKVTKVDAKDAEMEENRFSWKKDENGEKLRKRTRAGELMAALISQKEETAKTGRSKRKNVS